MTPPPLVLQITSLVSFFQRSLFLILLAVIWASLIFLAELAGAFRDLDQPLLDWRQSQLSSIPLVEKDLALIEIDRIPSGREWPWSRLDYAILLRSLLPYSPQSVIFEMLLNDRDTQYSSFDEQFASTVENFDEVIFAAAALTTPSNEPSPHSIDTLETSHPPHQMASFESLLWPLETFAGQSRIGISNLLPENSMQPRRIPLVFWYRDQLIPSLALQAAASRLQAHWPLSEAILGHSIHLRDKKGQLLQSIPIDNEGRLLMRYRQGYPEPWQASFADIPVYAQQSERGEEPDQHLRDLKNRLILVGRTDEKKFHPIPGVLPSQSSVEVQLLVIRNLLNADFIYPLPAWLLFFGYLTIAVGLSFLIYSYGQLPGFALISLLLWTWWEGALFTFRTWNIDMPVFSVAILTLGLLPLTYAARYWKSLDDKNNTSD